jgi:hypothetical protein
MSVCGEHEQVGAIRRQSLAMRPRGLVHVRGMMRTRDSKQREQKKRETERI